MNCDMEFSDCCDSRKRKADPLPTVVATCDPLPPCLTAVPCGGGPCMPCEGPCSKMRYVQPPVPKSFKPDRKYCPPSSPLESCTVYRMSFEKTCTAGCKPAPMRVHDNLKPSVCKFSDDTTQKHDYQCWPCARPACPVLPCNRNVIGEGPLSSLTTNRHDFVPKQICRLDPIKPPTQLRCSEKPLENTTIMAASYQPPCNQEPVCSYKPIITYKEPCQPFQDETVQKLSYVPWPLKRKEHYPWACKGNYICPTQPMEKCTIMNSSYQTNCGDHRRSAMKNPGAGNIISDGRCFENCTIYRESFFPADSSNCKPPPMRVHDNLKPSICKFEDDTTQKHDFRCWPCARPACPIIPCNRNVIGEGPLSCLTTNRHDYVPKQTCRIDPIKPPTQLRCSEKPLECTTIMNASYQPPCNQEPVCSYKPIVTYKEPCQPFQDETVQKLSYVPWPLKRKEHYPWACKGTYICPALPMENCTIMNSSYQTNCGDHRRSAMKNPGAGNIISDGRCFENCTIYRESFFPADTSNCKPPPMRVHDNLKPSICKFEDDTTQKHDFRCWPCARPACPIIPCNRNVIGEGPLSCLTTNRHDYVPKPVCRIDPIKPPTQLRCSEKPLENTTIMRASFQAPNRLEPMCSYKPILTYKEPCQPFQDETVQKLSYVPWPLKRKEHYPWACKGSYVCPSKPMECTSIYKASFFPPGACMETCASPCAPANPGLSTCKASCFGDCCRGVPVC